MSVQSPTKAGGARLDEFLADDFARLDESQLDRCMRLSGKRLYLTGATGFFGRNILALLSYLSRRGATFEVTAISREPERFLSEHSWCRQLHWLDWHQANAVDPWPGSGEYDLMLHAATDTSADWHRDKLAVFNQISRTVLRGLEFAEKHAVRRLLLCGSGAQYGGQANGGLGISDFCSQACESTESRSAYGEAKRVCELLAAIHAETQRFQVVNTRCFAFVGPGIPLNGHFAIGNFIRDAILNKPITLNTAGTAMRSYLYSADLAVWLLVLLLEGGDGLKINVGSDIPMRIIDLAKKVRDIVAPGLKVQSGPEEVDGERSFYVPSIQVAKGLNLDVWTNLDDAIRRTTDWYRDRRPRKPAEIS